MDKGRREQHANPDSLYTIIVPANETRQPSAVKKILCIIYRFRLGALKPTKRYLHLINSHLHRQFWDDKGVS